MDMTISEWLDEIERENPDITPGDLLKMAADPSCPAHNFFEWDDEKAGHAHRVWQARTLLSRRVVITTDSYSLTVPRYVRNPEAQPSTQSYIATRSISVEDLQHQTLAQEFARARALLERTRELSRMFGLMREVDEMVERLGLMSAKVVRRRPDEDGLAA
jgi:hypothetical protein